MTASACPNELPSTAGIAAWMPAAPRPRRCGPEGNARRMAGFTLIELMIAVAVVGILIALALPSFLGQLRQTRRADALDAAAAVQQAQERFRANNLSYATALSQLDLTSVSVSGYYGMSLSGVSRQGYTLTLNALAGKSQANDSGCTAMVVTVVKGVPSNTPAACWRK